MKFLHYDSPLITTIRHAVDYMLLGIMWFLACVPIITFGAATVAMLRTAESSIYKDEDGIFIPFWKHFATEFKQSTLLWLIQLPILAALVFYFILIWKGNLPFIVDLLSCLLIAVVFSWTQLWFGYQSKFEDNLKTVLMNTLRIALANMGKSFLLALFLVLAVLGSCVVILIFEPVLLIIPGLYVYAYSSVFRKLAEKLIPKEEIVEPAPTE